MSTVQVNLLIEDYLGRLDTAAWVLPPDRRRELVSEIREHRGPRSGRDGGPGHRRACRVIGVLAGIALTWHPLFALRDKVVVSLLPIALVPLPFLSAMTPFRFGPTEVILVGPFFGPILGGLIGALYLAVRARRLARP